MADSSGSGATFAENVLVTSNGQKMATGSALIRVGYFVSLTPTVISNLANPDKATVYAELDSANFVELGTGGNLGTKTQTGGPRLNTRTINGVTGVTGRLIGNINDVVPGAGGVPSGTRLFLFVYNALTTTEATELGIFSADDASWKMPSDTLASTILNTTFVDTPGEIFRGSQGSLKLAALVPVPEPSVTLFAVVSLAFGFSRRRR